MTEAADRQVVFRERKRIGFFMLPWTFTVYSISKAVLTIKSGLLKTTEDDCYLYRVQDVRLTRTLGERIFGTGTVHLYTGDASTPNIKLIHIKHSQEIKDFLLDASEEARIKRRTVSMQHIDHFDGDEDMY